MSFVALTMIAATGAALIAGIFFAFSAFVMTSLDRAGPRIAVAAMQSINSTILHSLFLPIFFGTAILALALPFVAYDEVTASQWLASVSGSLLYLLGLVLVTIAFNVPRNSKLATFSASSEEASRYWSDYRHSWTLWNHVRTLASTASFVCYVVSIGVSNS